MAGLASRYITQETKKKILSREKTDVPTTIAKVLLCVLALEGSPSV
jgi:hypothetical protein